MTLSRYKMYVQTTGDTSWGKAPIWLNGQYFKFCEETNRNPNFFVSPNGSKVAQMQPDEHEPFNEWLIKTYNLKREDITI